MSTRKNAFDTGIIEIVLRLGGWQGVREALYIKTLAGPLRVLPKWDYVDCRFDDPRAASQLTVDPVDPQTGEWNHEYLGKSIRTALKEFEETLRKVLP